MTLMAYGLAPIVAAWAALSVVASLNPLVRIGASVGLALAVTSLAFLSARALGFAPAAYLRAELVLSLVVIGFAWFRKRRVATGPTFKWFDQLNAVIASVLLSAAVGAAAYVLVYWMRVHPHGGTDAWAMWSVRAAFLASNAPEWFVAFVNGSPIPHPDYPLLLPASVARMLAATADRSIAAAVVQVLTLVGLVATVAGSVAELRGTMFAVLAVALLLTTELVQQAAYHNADLLLGFYTILALCLFANGRSNVHGYMAGFACGCAAWTKNEGIVVAIVVPVLFVVRSMKANGRGTAADLAANSAIGLWSLLMLVFGFKLWTPQNDLVEGLLRPGFWRYWLDPVRVLFVGREMALGVLRWGAASSLVLPPAILATTTALLPKRGHRDGLATVGLLLLFTQLLVFFLVYVMTPHSVAWHVGTSWDRLVAQMWPTAVWSACTSMGVASLQKTPPE
ncbi:MAG: hypothetical protein IT180_15705 [Acidobacteria bacterium]|nr:hypothetical protein [Acidobacteriota bacterium]